jgi:hypothetical protein
MKKLMGVLAITAMLAAGGCTEPEIQVVEKIVVVTATPAVTPAVTPAITVIQEKYPDKKQRLYKVFAESIETQYTLRINKLEESGNESAVSLATLHRERTFAYEALDVFMTAFDDNGKVVDSESLSTQELIDQLDAWKVIEDYCKGE